MTLPINDLIVPADVTQGYLEGYTAKELDTIEQIYQQVEAQQLNPITDAPQPGASVFVLVAGSQGVGKSRLTKRLIAERSEQYAVCDVDSILMQFPEVQKNLADIPSQLQEAFYAMNDYSPNDHRAQIEQAVGKFRNAAKYISDRLMTRCVADGYNVIVETNAKTPHIGAFIAAVKKTGVVLDGHICEAPLSVKLKGAHSREHGISFAEETLRAEHDAMRKNIPTIAGFCDSNFTVWWRQDVRAPLTQTAVGTRESYTEDLLAKTGFEAHFADNGTLTIAGLMGRREPFAKPETAPQIKVA